MSVVCGVDSFIAATLTPMYEYQLQLVQHLSSSKCKSTHNIVESHTVFPTFIGT